LWLVVKAGNRIGTCPSASSKVDAFTNRTFAGNPAAVCVLLAAKPDSWMRDVASEMNPSEAAFLVRQNGRFQLRWLTPAIEVDLCGQPTSPARTGSGRKGIFPKDAGQLHTRSGLLTSDRRGDWIELDFREE